MADRKSFLLRIDPELWAELEAWAQDELRSVNGQIEFLLKQAVRQRKRTVGGHSTASFERQQNSRARTSESTSSSEGEAGRSV
jgi:hypothetical protein